MTQVHAPVTVKRHPVLGAVAGLLFGIGLALLLVAFAVIALGTLTPVVVVLLSMVAAATLSMVLPPIGGRDSKAAPPEAHAPAPVAGAADPRDPPADPDAGSAAP
jgi:hypothetical protein